MHKSLVIFVVTTDNEANVEQVRARIQLLDRSIYVGAVYVPPGTGTDAYSQVVNSTKDVFDSADSADCFFVTGDFNCVATWFPDSDDPSVLRFTDASPSDTAFVDAGL